MRSMMAEVRSMFTSKSAVPTRGSIEKTLRMVGEGSEREYSSKVSCSTETTSTCTSIRSWPDRVVLRIRAKASWIIDSVRM
ncbi:hypothetical protein D3C86_1982820 [compost metagenome]